MFEVIFKNGHCIPHKTFFTSILGKERKIMYNDDYKAIPNVGDTVTMVAINDVTGEVTITFKSGKNIRVHVIRKNHPPAETYVYRKGRTEDEYEAWY